jgi:hypothetical protein
MAGFGEFGIKAFADHRGVIYGSVSALMVLVWILLIVAMAGGSTDGNTIQNCAWSIYPSPVNVYFGTLAFHYDFETSASNGNIDITAKYSDSKLSQLYFPIFFAPFD